MTATATATAARQTATVAYADALFTASLALGEIPPASLVVQTVRDTIVRCGVGFCAATVAAEFGEHPEVAVARMAKVRELVAGLSTTGVDL